MIILGIDPGYAIIGWGVVEYQGIKHRPVAFGAITTEAHTDFNLRLKQIYDDMVELIERSKPDVMSIEKLYFNQNITTGITVAEARGICILVARQHNIPIYEYTPLQIKQTMTGYGRAKKKAMQEAVREYLKMQEVVKPDDAADALAAAITHALMTRIAYQ